MNISFEMAKEMIHHLVKQADEEPELDFLTLLGEYRMKVVYKEKQLTPKEFDEVCKQVLAELPDDD